MSGGDYFDFDTSFSQHDIFSKNETEYFSDENEFDETDIDDITAILAKYSTNCFIKNEKHNKQLKVMKTKEPELWEKARKPKPCTKEKPFHCESFEIKDFEYTEMIKKVKKYETLFRCNNKLRFFNLSLKL